MYRRVHLRSLGVRVHHSNLTHRVIQLSAKANIGGGERDCVVAQRVNPHAAWDTCIPSWTAALSSGYSTSELASCYCAWQAADEGSPAWVPAIHVGDPCHGVPGSWLQPSPARSLRELENELVDETRISSHLPPCNSPFHINKSIFKHLII